MTGSRLADELLAEVGDGPEVVDARGVLLEAGTEIFGDREGAVAVRSDGQLHVAFGRPGAEVVDAARRLARDDAELVAYGDTVEVVRSILAAPGERAVLHAPGVGGLRRPDSLPRAELLDPAMSLDHLPEALRREIEEVLPRRPVAVVVEAGRPVAFCHAAVVSERWWDVSIETLETYRRGGRAAATFFRLARVMRRDGLEPVWGAVESNVASLALAAKLGFEPVGELVLFEYGDRAGRTGSPES